jgi:diadenylate cyclase
MEYILEFWGALKSLVRTFGISDAFDVLVVSFLIYNFIKLIRETRAEQLVKGILVFVFAYVLSYQLQFRMLSTILNNFFQFGVIAILVVFQPELRRALEHVGRSKIGGYWRLNSILQYGSDGEDNIKNVICVVVKSCDFLQKSRTGALIVFERATGLGDVISTGTVIKAQATFEIISNIFYNKAPLHDGAVIIKDGLVYAGGCILPLTKNKDISTAFGTRHRAAMGISENSDAIAVAVSEETGNISIAVDGVLQPINSAETLHKKLDGFLLQDSKSGFMGYRNIVTTFKKVAKK